MFLKAFSGDVTLVVPNTNSQGIWKTGVGDFTTQLYGDYRKPLAFKDCNNLNVCSLLLKCWDLDILLTQKNLQVFKPCGNNTSPQNVAEEGEIPIFQGNPGW